MTSSARLTSLPDGEPELDARQRLLLAAERLFGETGYKAVSLRQLGAAAGVNTALIGYYFGGKEGLFTEAYRMNAKPINAERSQRLRALMQGPLPPTLEQVLRTWIEPVFLHDAAGERHLFIRMMAFLADERQPFYEELVFSTHGATNAAFLDVLQGLLPALSRGTLMWRLYFLIGMFSVATKGRPAGMFRLSGGKAAEPDPQRNLTYMLDFALAGFQAPDSGSDTPS